MCSSKPVRGEFPRPWSVRVQHASAICFNQLPVYTPLASLGSIADRVFVLSEISAATNENTMALPRYGYEIRDHPRDPRSSLCFTIHILRWDHEVISNHCFLSNCWHDQCEALCPTVFENIKPAPLKGPRGEGIFLPPPDSLLE